MAQGLTKITIPATLPGVVTPVFGRDLFCTTDLDPGMLEVDGLTCLGQALFRRITTPRGQVIDDPNYGFDVTQFLNDDLAQSDLARIAAGVDAEFLKDERVYRSSTTVTLLLNTLTVSCLVTPTQGPAFALVVSANQVTAQLLLTSQ